nr:hypothetical protein [uncultured Flavobacterium sp.]
MNKPNNIDEKTLYKPVIVLFVIGLIIFLSSNKSVFSDSNDPSLFILGWFISGIIAIIVYVFIIRWTFKVNEIVNNQEKTNQLLENIYNILSKSEKSFLEESDVNDPDNLKKIIDNLK